MKLYNEHKTSSTADEFHYIRIKVNIYYMYNSLI